MQKEIARLATGIDNSSITLQYQLYNQMDVERERKDKYFESNAGRVQAA